jgi:hypothetical protein
LNVCRHCVSLENDLVTVYLNAGFARKLWGMKTGIRLSKMIIASTHSESGCHEDRSLVRREVRQPDSLGAFLF